VNRRDDVRFPPPAPPQKPAPAPRPSPLLASLDAAARDLDEQHQAHRNVRIERTLAMAERRLELARQSLTIARYLADDLGMPEEAEHEAAVAEFLAMEGAEVLATLTPKAPFSARLKAKLDEFRRTHGPELDALRAEVELERRVAETRARAEAEVARRNAPPPDSSH
jgi:hypothetical protein